MKNKLIILTTLLITWAIFHVIEASCAEPASILIRPGESRNINQTKPAPPLKRGSLVIPRRVKLPALEQKEHLEKLLTPQADQPVETITPTEEEILTLPAISFETENDDQQPGQFFANQPISLKGKNKATVASFPNSQSPTYPGGVFENRQVDRNEYLQQDRPFHQQTNIGNRKRQGATLLPQIEVPADETLSVLPPSRNINISSEQPQNRIAPPPVNRGPQHKQDRSRQIQPTGLINNSVRPSMKLTGIQTNDDDDDDYYDVEYLRTAAGLDNPTEKEMEDQHLPPLEEELANHGGSHLYHPEGDEFYYDNNGACDNRCDEHSEHAHQKPLRLPEYWQKPKPLTGHQEFLGPDFIKPSPGLQWFGEEGYQWEPRFVGHGSYEIFGTYFKQGDREQSRVGHQLLVDLDMRITGTERAHVQFRPVGRKNSGGSIYRFQEPTGYEDNSTLIPDRYWVEGEFRSIFGGCIDDTFIPLDYHIVLGKFPLALQNNLLITDDVLGVAINKNTILIPPFSNMNIQFFYLFDDVDTTLGPTADVVGTNTTIDYQGSLIETTFAQVSPSGQQNRETTYAAAALTKFIGQHSVAGRALYKTGESNTLDDAFLYVLESNYHTPLPESLIHCTGFEHAVIYSNAFHATEGWVSISSGDFDRLRSTFEVDPLISITRGVVNDDTTGVSFGSQFFANNEDESVIPEFAYEEIGSDNMYGFSFRYLYKLNPRTFLDCRTIQTWSNNSNLERKGIFASTTVIF